MNIRPFFLKKGIKYWEYRQENIFSEVIEVSSDTVKEMKYSIEKGHSIRILYNGRWAFASSEDGSVKKLVEKALRISKNISAAPRNYLAGKVNVESQVQIKDRKSVEVKINPKDISLNEKKNILLEITKAGIKDKKIRSIGAKYSFAEKEKYFENSEGSEIWQKQYYTRGSVNMAAFEKGRLEESSDVIAGQAGFELMKNIFDCYNNALTTAKELLKGETIKGGNYPVVVDGKLASVFIHEALGHAAEADHIESKYSCLIGKLNRRIAAECVNIYDDSSINGLWGSFFYDDEGIKAKKTPIIKNGILKNFMHSRESALKNNAELTGNARAESYASQPLIRMSNTILEKGDYNKDELFEGIKYGVYLLDSNGGQVSPLNGNFQFSAKKGYLIENGKPTKLLRGVGLSGNTLQILSQIGKISKNYDPPFIGYCGKGGQRVPVTGLCPSIMINKAVVGGK